MVSPPFGTYRGTSHGPDRNKLRTLVHVPTGRVIATLRSSRQCRALAAELAPVLLRGDLPEFGPVVEKTFSERPDRPLGDMRLPVDRALLCLHLLCEGNAVRAVARITGTEKKTILRLLVQVGEGCERLLAETVKAVPVKDVQADELWTYIRCKQGTRERNKITDPDAGDAYCYIGIERHSKAGARVAPGTAEHLGRA
jgi:hypothetical protein